MHRLTETLWSRGNVNVWQIMMWPPNVYITLFNKISCCGFYDIKLSMIRILFSISLVLQTINFHPTFYFLLFTFGFILLMLYRMWSYMINVREVLGTPTIFPDTCYKTRLTTFLIPYKNNIGYNVNWIVHSRFILV